MEVGEMEAKLEGQSIVPADVAAQKGLRPVEHAAFHCLDAFNDRVTMLTDSQAFVELLRETLDSPDDRPKDIPEDAIVAKIEGWPEDWARMGQGGATA
jgi:hypothetical protein